MRKMNPRPVELIDLLATPIVGNAYHDHDIFGKAHEIIMNENYEMDHRIAAIQKVDDTMGLGETCTQVQVNEYVAEFPDELIHETLLPH